MLGHLTINIITEESAIEMRELSTARSRALWYLYRKNVLYYVVGPIGFSTLYFLQRCNYVVFVDRLRVSLLMPVFMPHYV